MAKKKAPITAVLTGAGDAPVANKSTTVTEGFTDGGPNPHYCPGCDKHEVQFVTRGGVTALRCKACDREAEPADEGEAQSLKDYNRNA